MVIILRVNKDFVSIRWKLVSTYLILIVICLMFTGSFIAQVIEINNMSVKETQLLQQSNILADRIVFGYKYNTLLDQSIEHLVEISSKELKSKVIILDHEGIIITQSHNKYKINLLSFPEVEKALNGNSATDDYFIEEKGHTMVVATPISYGRTIQGAVVIVSPLEELDAQTNDTLKKYLVFSLMIILITTLISLLFSHYISSPLEKLTYSINKIYHGNMDQKVEIQGNDELSNLGKAFNLMSTKLSQVDKQRKDFVASVSHELRTPLSAMKILSESLLLQKDAKIETYREFLKDIDSEVNRLNNIIEDLLSLVDMDKEKLQLYYEDTNLNSLVKNLVYSLKPLANKKRLVVKFHKSEEIKIPVDQVKIEQAIVNVVSNAIKYTQDGGEVGIWLYTEQDFAVVKIKDNGIGIPEESIPYIFDKFYRVDKARSRSTGGTGLGLSITKQIIELHQGRIIVESKVNKGSTFYIKIPKNSF